MIDIFLTMLILVLFIGMECFCVEKSSSYEFLSIENTTAIKGIACIIIVFVHIPYEYTNIIQNVTGSFAYIGVTLFFLLSAYGCKYGIENKEKYLEKFWKKRLFALLLPAIILNIINFLFYVVFDKSVILSLLITINEYILAIIVAYFIIWVIWKCKFIKNKYKDWVICFIVVIFSLSTYLTPFKPFYLWPIESIGLILGILLFKFRLRVEEIIKLKKIWIIGISFFSSIILGVIYLRFKNIFFLGGYLIRVILVIAILSFGITLTYGIDFTRQNYAKKLGIISYEVYLGHLIVVDFARFLVPKASSGVFITIVFVGTITIAIICKFICTKVGKLR